MRGLMAHYRARRAHVLTGLAILLVGVSVVAVSAMTPSMSPQALLPAETVEQAVSSGVSRAEAPSSSGDSSSAPASAQKRESTPEEDSDAAEGLTPALQP